MPPFDVRSESRALLRAALTPDVAQYASEMPVSPAFGRLLRRVTPEPPPCPCGDCRRKLKQEEHRDVREYEPWRDEQ